MVDNLEGFPESIRFLKKNSDWAKNAPLFSDILFCREEYRVAIENYLEPLMNHYVVDTYNEAIRAINLLSNSAQGRAQFFVLDSYEALDSDLTVSWPGAVPALNVVEVEKHYQPLCNHLLKNVYLVDDSSEQALNNAVLPAGVVLIGKSGKFNKSKYAMAGGSVGLFEGKRIGRAKNLDNLLKVIKLIDIEVADFKARSNELQEKLSALKLSGKAAEIKQKEHDLNLLNTELITVKTRQEQYLAFIENSLNRKADIVNKISSLKDETLVLQPLLEELKNQKEAQNDLLADKQSTFNELNEYVTTQSNAYNQENIRFHQQQNKISGLIKDLEYRQTQQEGLDTRIKQNNAELVEVKIAIQENLQQADNSDEDLVAMYGQKDELEKATQQAEQEYYEWRGKITETENEVTALETAKKGQCRIDRK